jgi:RNA polymerase sigma factor (sigma-70 family)
MDDGSGAVSVSHLVERHYDLIYRFAYRLSGSAADAEDLAQDAFLTAQTKLHQLREGEKARSWLLTIVRSAFLKSRRGQQQFAFSALDDPPQPAVDEEVEQSLLVEIDNRQLQEALDELPEEFRTPLVLFYFEEFTYKQIAEIVDAPIGTVMSRLSRAKSHLRNRLRQRQTAAAWMEPAARH